MWLVNAGVVPAELAGTEWRMLDVDKVIAEVLAAHPEAQGKK